MNDRGSGEVLRCCQAIGEDRDLPFGLGELRGESGGEAEPEGDRERRIGDVATEINRSAERFIGDVAILLVLL